MIDTRGHRRAARFSENGGVLFVAIALLAAVTAWLVTGVTLLQVLIYLAYWVLVIAVPGRFIWRGVIRRHESLNPPRRNIATALEEWSCGAAVGYVIELPSYVLARAVGLPLLFLIVPGALVVANLYAHTRLRDQRPDSRGQLGWAPAVALGGVVAYLIAWLGVYVFSGHPLNSGVIVDPDEMFHLSLIGELRNHFPATYPYLQYPGPLTYQWFVDAHMAASSWATGLTPDLIYRRFDPLVLTAISVVGVSALAARVSRRAWSGPLAAGILVLVGSFDVTGALPESALPEERFLLGLVIVHSPTQTLASVLAIPVMLLCLELVRPATRGRASTWIALLAGLLALSGAKVTYIPMFACGFVAVLGIRAVRARTVSVPAAAGVGLTLAVVLSSAWLLYGGDSQSLQLSPLQTSRFFMESLGIKGGGRVGQMMIAAALLTMWLIPASGVVGLLRVPATRWDTRAWWLLGTGASGYGATFLLGHGGESQLYFGRSAALPLAVASAWGIVALFPPEVTRRSASSAGVVAASGGLLLFAIRSATERWRGLAPVNGEMVEAPMLRLWINLVALMVLILAALLVRIAVRDLSRGRRTLRVRFVIVFFVGLGLARAIAFVTPPSVDLPAPESRWRYGAAGRESADWLRQHSDPGDRVMTNAHCGPVLPAASQSECDARHFWMSALSERRFVLEGWAYTARSGEWTEDYWGNPRLLLANDAVFTQPSERSLAGFARRHGARWLFVDQRFPAHLDGLRQLGNTVQRLQRGPYSVLEIMSYCGSIKDKC